MSFAQHGVVRRKRAQKWTTIMIAHPTHTQGPYFIVPFPFPFQAALSPSCVWYGGNKSFFFLLLRKWTNPAKNSPLVIPSAKLFSIHHLVLGQSVFTADFPRDFPFCQAQDVVRRDVNRVCGFSYFLLKKFEGKFFENCVWFQSKLYETKKKQIFWKQQLFDQIKFHI